MRHLWLPPLSSQSPTPADLVSPLTLVPRVACESFAGLAAAERAETEDRSVFLLPYGKTVGGSKGPRGRSTVKVY